MQETKHLLLILVFVFISLGTLIYSLSMGYQGEDLKKETKKRSQSGGEDSFFTGVSFYLLSNEVPFLNLKATELNVKPRGKQSVFFNPDGYVFTKQREKVFYKGKRGRFYQGQEEIFLEEEVVLNTTTSQVNADFLNYNHQTDRVYSSGAVKTKTHAPKTGDRIFVESDELRGNPLQGKFRYLNNVKGKIKRKRVYEEGVAFSATTLYLDLEESHVSLDGNVALNKSSLSAQSERGEIFLENYNKRLKYYALFDDVKVSEKLKLKNGKTVFRKSFSEQLEGVVSEDKIILTGYPKVIQESDVIKGNKIVLRENNEVVEVDDASTNFILK